MALYGITNHTPNDTLQRIYLEMVAKMQAQAPNVDTAIIGSIAATLTSYHLEQTLLDTINAQGDNHSRLDAYTCMSRHYTMDDLRRRGITPPKLTGDLTVNYDTNRADEENVPVTFTYTA
ncbi:hypothetical protein C1Y63_04945 [Corynebacterium sp. 13CS0277]|uniref:hypothetical protein n=1 Tax=Corynebacterium sp. 13CS0277 TaxID=2071994 RepID=UPI000D045161|nr:hypothetical protein [Corynebacterium sp. 13CS0277]PRQ11759.1 hypothetical protein C1Y63_04945 [Corynebacterium sp. 13CS0277]